MRLYLAGAVRSVGVGPRRSVHHQSIFCEGASAHRTTLSPRGTAILARAEQGYEVDEIANDIGMSRQNVERCMRFKDQMRSAPTAKSGRALSSRRTRPRTPGRLYRHCKSPHLENS